MPSRSARPSSRRDEPLHRGRPVAPPAVGPRPEDVHAVDDQPLGALPHARRYARRALRLARARRPPRPGRGRGGRRRAAAASSSAAPGPARIERALARRARSDRPRSSRRPARSSAQDDRPSGSHLLGGCEQRGDRGVGAEEGDPPAPRREATARRRSGRGREARRRGRRAGRAGPRRRPSRGRAPSSRPRIRLLAKCSCPIVLPVEAARAPGSSTLVEERVDREDVDRAVERPRPRVLVEGRKRRAPARRADRRRGDRRASTGSSPRRRRTRRAASAGARPAADQVEHPPQAALVGLAVEAVAGVSAARLGDAVAPLPRAQRRRSGRRRAAPARRS